MLTFRVSYKSLATHCLICHIYVFFKCLMLFQKHSVYLILLFLPDEVNKVVLGRYDNVHCTL